MAEGTLHTQLWSAILHRRVNRPMNWPERRSTAVLPRISHLHERCEHINWGRTLLRGGEGTSSPSSFSSSSSPSSGLALGHLVKSFGLQESFSPSNCREKIGWPIERNKCNYTPLNASVRSLRRLQSNTRTT